MVEERMIYHGTLSLKADPTARGTGWRSDLEIRLRRRSAVERELGLADYPALLHGRKVEAGIFHRAFELAGAIACEEDRRHMGLDGLDRLDCPPIRGRLAQENR
jgi:hypothetical protein